MPLSNVLQFKNFLQISPINLDNFLPLSAVKSREISLKIFNDLKFVFLTTFFE